MLGPDALCVEEGPAVMTTGEGHIVPMGGPGNECVGLGDVDRKKFYKLC